MLGFTKSKWGDKTIAKKSIKEKSSLGFRLNLDDLHVSFQFHKFMFKKIFFLSKMRFFSAKLTFAEIEFIF